MTTEEAILPPLETPCTACEGLGRVMTREWADCDGAGTVPTDAGRAVLALMEHHGRRT